MARAASSAGRKLGWRRREFRAFLRARGPRRTLFVRLEDPARDRADCDALADQPGLALLSAGGAAGIALRLPRAWAVRSETGAALQSQQAAARSLRQAYRRR